MNLCVLTYMYPGRHNHSDFAFVKQLVDTMARQGHKVSVVCPYNFLHYKKYCPSYEKEIVDGGLVTIVRPWYFSFSSSRIGSSLTSFFYKRALKKAFKKISRPDAIYGHFWHIAFQGYEYAQKRNIPLFVASGESEIALRLNNSTKDFCDYVSGVICVSTKNRNESVTLGLATREKCIILPNAIDNNLFHLSEQQALKTNLGIKDNDFVVAFVGWFNERKGSKRVAEALTKLANPSIKAIFIGYGEADPVCPGILFKGSLPHNEIPNYLNCADVFVLPTLSEGCCNAIVEAMACGLPVVSSNREFNWDILDETNSILVEPTDVDEIAMAINQMYEDKAKRLSMREASLKKVKGLTIESRAKKIIATMLSLINSDGK